MPFPFCDMKKMKLGIADRAFEVFGEERFAVMKALGFDYADISLDGELDGLNEEEYLASALAVKELAEASGVTVHQVHGPWIHPTKDETPEARELRAVCMRRSLRATAAIGCKNWVIHPVMPFGSKAEPDAEAFWRINREFFSELLPYAKERGITVCFENMPFPALSMSSPEATLRFVREMKDPSFQFCLDTGHSFVMGTDPAEAVAMAGKELQVLHVHDNCGLRDEHLLPFMGKIQWRDFYRALCDSDFDGVLSLEVKISKDLSREGARTVLETIPVLLREMMQN